MAYVYTICTDHDADGCDDNDEDDDDETGQKLWSPTYTDTKKKRNSTKRNGHRQNAKRTKIQQKKIK